MINAKMTPFFQIFSAYNPSDEGLILLLSDCMVTHMSADRNARAIHVNLLPGKELPEWALAQIRADLGRIYQAERVELILPPNPQKEAAPTPEIPPEVPAAPTPEGAAPAAEEDATALFRRADEARKRAMLAAAGKTVKPKGEKPSKPSGKTIFGKISTKKITPMCDLSLDCGTVVVEGDVFNVDHRKLRNRSDRIVRFDLTDYTGSVRVSQFMTNEESEGIVREVAVGQRLRVQGKLTVDRYDNEMVMQPTGILRAEETKRRDDAREKRVELHLHTRMSAMDALTDVKEVVRRAAEWGHPAIAITDHGVAHSFPDAAAAGRRHGVKILYGVEAYYYNDVDENLAVSGDCALPINGEYVVFDIETTGLNPRRDAITEIGAVVVKNGRVTKETFSTFADPARPLPPKIIELTGITDEMLRGAPSQERAVHAFLDFVAGRPIVAHNASFDVGFIAAAAGRMGRTFRPATVDTLALARRLYPDLPNHKLDTLVRHLGIGTFNHHRAADDAAVTAEVFLREGAAFAARGFERLDEAMAAPVGAAAHAPNRRAIRHLILLAKNKTGLRNLYRLISLAHLDHFSRFPLMPKSLINQHREGLILGSACEAGEVFQAIVAGRPREDLLRLASWYDYLEIQPLSNNAFMTRPARDGTQIAAGEEELRGFNRAVVALGQELQKPVCATGDVHFLEPRDEIYRHILLDSKNFDDADEPNPLYFRTTTEMLEEFAYLGAEGARAVVVTGPNTVAGWCEAMEPLPKGLFTPTLDNSAEELTHLVWSRARELYGERLPQLVIDRVKAELDDIIGCHYDVIYMSAQKLVQSSLENGYLVGSRGSVGSSVVAFLAGITEVNALPPHYRCPNCKHTDFAAGEGCGCGADMPSCTCPKCGAQYEKDGFHIPFETFLGFGGDKVPDIDLNFSGEYQPKAHRDTFALFGEHHVFRAGTIGTVALKTAYGYVKKYMEKRGRHVSRAEEHRLALGCTGVKRTTGQHPGGMVVIPRDKEVYDFCPVQHPADDKNSDIITTHFEYHAMEDNLLKLDLLGHDDPSMIRMLQDLTGVDPRKIPLDDPDTMSIFTDSGVLGYAEDKVLGPTGAAAIPEFGTSFVRGMLVDTAPTEFDILVRLSGFSHGTDVWLGNAKDLILSGTAGVSEAIGCRDDIMLYLIRLGMDDKTAFQVMESVRKGRGLPKGTEEAMRAIGVPDWYIGSCKKIQYLFPKAHAVAYVMMAFRIAWFKVHRPLAFYAAYFSIRAKAFDATVMCQGMQAVQAKMKQIIAKDKEASDVERDMLVTLEVCYEFYLRGFHFEAIDLYRSDATRFLPNGERGTLLPPFTAVPGLGETAAQSIIQQRTGRQFISIAEFAAVCPKVSKTHIEKLKEAGALANMPESSQLSLF